MGTVMEAVKRTARYGGRTVGHHEAIRSTRFKHAGAEFSITTFRIVPHGTGVGQWGYGYRVYIVRGQQFQPTRRHGSEDGYPTRRIALREAKDHIRFGFYDKDVRRGR